QHAGPSLYGGCGVNLFGERGVSPCSGFVQQRQCKGFQEEVWTKVYKVRGTRYLAKGFELPASVSKFNHDYEIIVRESHSPGVKRAMVLLTPVTLAMDGVLVLGGIVLAPVALIVLSNTHWR
ncbi:hypothetical protein ACFFT9_21885, partial [Chromobacterium violaceum]|uniref:hypothetical protein n=2 Tax=Chromobacterium violaceum TaxID=536 RepID=UPI0035EBEA36